MDNEFYKIPPNDIEAEAAFLGCMLFDEFGLSTGYEILKEEDFYKKNNQIIFAAISELYSNNVPVDLITLKNILEKKEIFEEVGGLGYITNIASSVATSANIVHYGKIIEEKSSLRKLLKVSGQIHESGYKGAEIDSIVDMAEKDLRNIIEGRNTKEFSNIGEILVDSISNLETLFNSKEKITGVATGFVDLDKKTAGLQKSDLVLIAARPSMGKTAFCLNIAQYAAVMKNKSVAIFSLEMAKEQLVNRMLCAEAKVDSNKLRTGTLDDVDWMNIAEGVGVLANTKIAIDDTPGINIIELRSKCRKVKQENGLDLVIIDYLQLMSGTGRSESRQQEISDISRSLKSIARELEVPIIALSQLSRASEKRNDHRPMLSDLRDSGAIEQDADLVAFLYRDEYYNPDTEKKNIAEVIIAKQRNGETGTIELGWNGKYTRFSNLEYSNN